MRLLHRAEMVEETIRYSRACNIKAKKRLKGQGERCYKKVWRELFARSCELQRKDQPPVSMGRNSRDKYSISLSCLHWKSSRSWQERKCVGCKPHRSASWGLSRRREHTKGRNTWTILSPTNINQYLFLVKWSKPFVLWRLLSCIKSFKTLFLFRDPKSMNLAYWVLYSSSFESIVNSVKMTTFFLAIILFDFHSSGIFLKKK